MCSLLRLGPFDGGAKIRRRFDTDAAFSTPEPFGMELALGFDMKITWSLTSKADAATSTADKFLAAQRLEADLARERREMGRR